MSDTLQGTTVVVGTLCVPSGHPGPAVVGPGYNVLLARVTALETAIEFYVWRSRVTPAVPASAGLDHPGNGNGNGKRRRKNGGA